LLYSAPSFIVTPIETKQRREMKFETDAKTVMEGTSVNDAISNLIWAAIPATKRDTVCPIPSLNDAVEALLDAVIDKVDNLENTPYQYTEGDGVDAAMDKVA